MEELFQYLWKYRLFDTHQLLADNQVAIEIIDVGNENRDAGPDFFNAKIKFDHTLWAGNVEIHMKSSDWYKHGHDKDKRYDSVILNVVEILDTDIFRTNGETIPQLILRIPDNIREYYKHLVSNSSQIPCKEQWSELDPYLFSSWSKVLLIERLERKTDTIQNLLLNNQNNWEQAFYITLMRSFGLSVNNDAFERLARSLQLSVIQKHADSLLQIEALFFGQAGFLENDMPENSYYTLLKREYDFLKAKFSLKSLPPETWRFLRLRPANFPHIRIAQVASLYHQSSSLFSKMLTTNTFEEFYQLLRITPSAYWHTHYDFKNESEPNTKGLGKTALKVALINAVAPMLFAYGRATANDGLCEKSFDILDKLEAEDNVIVRNWLKLGVKIESASDSQAILQLQKEYCDKKKCLYCRVGHRILNRK